MFYVQNHAIKFPPLFMNLTSVYLIFFTSTTIFPEIYLDQSIYLIYIRIYHLAEASVLSILR